MFQDISQPEFPLYVISSVVYGLAVTVDFIPRLYVLRYVYLKRFYNTMLLQAVCNHALVIMLCSPVNFPE